MFDPTEFLVVARGLLGEGLPTQSFRAARAARVRTAYGRAYYALYLLVTVELMRRHHIAPRRLDHGGVYSKLQSPRAEPNIRQLGRELERLYRLRQQADYELAPGPQWRRHLENARSAKKVVALAADLAASLPRLDFASVVPLFRP